jgi:hypothetical protein
MENDVPSFTENIFTQWSAGAGAVKDEPVPAPVGVALQEGQQFRPDFRQQDRPALLIGLSRFKPVNTPAMADI